jgi:hypothetical protein
MAAGWLFSFVAIKFVYVLFGGDTSHPVSGNRCQRGLIHASDYGALIAHDKLNC